MPDKTDKTTKPTLPADNSVGMSIPASMLRVGVVEVAKDGSYVTVRLWPTMPAVRRALDMRFVAKRWTSEHHTVGRCVYCSINGRDGVFRSDYHLGADEAANEYESSLMAAAAAWDIGTGVLDMEPLRIGKDKVQINPVADRSGQRIDHYILDDVLSVDGISYAADGTVLAVRLLNRKGDKIEWRKS